MGTNQQRREAAKRKLDRQLARKAERAKRRKIIGIGVAAGVVIVVAGLVVVLTGQDEDQGAAGAQGGKTCEYPDSGRQPAKKAEPPRGSNVPASGEVNTEIDSTAGPIGLTLDREKAPCTVNSFVSLAEQNFFDDSACHRISTEGLKMLQCGDPSGKGDGGPGYTVPDEVDQNTTYPRGTIAMANEGQPNTGGSQFFLVFGDSQLPPQYTAFGTIDEQGLKTLDEVAKAGHDGSLDPSPGGGKPNKEVRFRDVKVDA